MKAIQTHLFNTTIAATLCVGIAGCSSIGSMLEGDKVDYKSATQGKTLDVPPDLTQLSKDNRYNLPDARSTSLSGQTTNINNNRSAVLPVIENISIQRNGTQRWLSIKNADAGVVFAETKEFWASSGFVVNLDNPTAGVMETDWAENRAKIPQDFIRNTIGKVFDSVYDSGERDKFRTRLERTAEGNIEIYISHRGMVEKLVGQGGTSTRWEVRPNDPELEAEFLARLMARLGVKKEQAKAGLAQASNAPAAAKLVDNTLQMTDPFDRAWRRVGLALDRSAFTVEDRDRVQGAYFVRYADPGDGKPEEKGFLSRWFGSEKKIVTTQYRIVVKSAADSSVVSVANAQGVADNSATAQRILKLLLDELK